MYRMIDEAPTIACAFVSPSENAEASNVPSDRNQPARRSSQTAGGIRPDLLWERASNTTLAAASVTGMAAKSSTDLPTEAVDGVQSP